MKQAATGLLLVALGALVAPGATFAAAPTLGASVSAEVYVHQDPHLVVLNRSDQPAVVEVQGEGWQATPDRVRLAPGQRTTLTVSGNGKDGAALNVRLVSTVAPPPGMGRGALDFAVKVYRDRPFDPAPLLTGLAAAFVVGVVGGILYRRRKAVRP